MKTKRITDSNNEALRASAKKLGITMDSALEFAISSFCTGVLLADRQTDTQLSDLEIVQKALYDNNASMNMYSDGSSSVYVEDDSGYCGLREYDFTNAESLLTWAKQTLGMEI